MQLQKRRRESCTLSIARSYPATRQLAYRRAPPSPNYMLARISNSALYTCFFSAQIIVITPRGYILHTHTSYLLGRWLRFINLSRSCHADLTHSARKVLFNASSIKFPKFNIKINHLSRYTFSIINTVSRSSLRDTIYPVRLFVKPQPLGVYPIQIYKASSATLSNPSPLSPRA